MAAALQDVASKVKMKLVNGETGKDGKDVMMAMEKANLAPRIMDAWLRATYEGSYLENDDLMALLSGSGAPRLTNEEALEWGRRILRNGADDPFMAYLEKVDAALNLFAIRQQIKGVEPALRPVEATLDEIGLMVQSLKAPEPGPEVRTVISVFMKKVQEI
jgi:hypothetical protein